MLQRSQNLPSDPITLKRSSSSDLENSSPMDTWHLTPPSDSNVLDIPKKSILENVKETPERRKSRRLHKQSMADDNELLANFHGGTGVLARGTVIPIGLGHTPFQFKVKVDENIQREQNKLKISMVPNFTIQNEVKYTSSQNVKSKYMLAKKEEDAVIQVGEEYQAVIDEWPQKYKEDEKERDELIWAPPPDDSIDHEICRNEYFRSIWRQYEGHIPFEVALQNLVINCYDFAKSLETIDQCLKTLPQKRKPLAEVQYKRFEELLLSRVTTRRVLQEKCMRNYHISEVHNFYHHFKNYYLATENTESCTCSDLLCAVLEFQERWACPNCTKNLKPTTSSDSLLCLICQTYSSFTGGKMLPATDITFSDEEVQKIMEWKKIEEENGGVPISKEDFEKIQMEATIKRMKNAELTDEECDIIDATKLPHRRRKNRLTEEEKNEIGIKLAEQLEHHPIPLFKICEAEKELFEKRKLEEGTSRPSLKRKLSDTRG